ncbi:hypothetical protein Xen7305DRAFT_00042350 [Xenococcus sp. PCC 7305]|uniref:hypothetical protein n=1 Tax=Xenococcus sp. PCC 7305 TaxID=102125 RepID=UPI0002AC39E0|nr:hypothetical protein [Xenococcus sp. PCC 7305]ELS04501.1 hypothetical protein Xen7305DRAFT_00042350 [Xenococcus sp. PCC 7305]
MTSNKDNDRNDDRDLAIQREILSGRKFSLAEAIGREGGSFLKGDSPVPKQLQAIAEINSFVKKNLSDPSGALVVVLSTWVKTDLRVVENLDSPLVALRQILSSLIDNQNLLYEFVRQVDFRWGQIYDERPYFQQPGQAAHPNDEYTHESVRLQLIELLDIVKSQNQ